MLTIFDGIKIEEFQTLFNSEEKCLEYLANKKWKGGYICRHCGHTKYCKGKTAFSRRCTKCKKEESATAHTIFHRCKIHLPEAFKLAHMVCKTPKISTSELSEKLNMRQMTCWKFKKKIMECIESRKDINDKSKYELNEIVMGKNKN